MAQSQGSNSLAGLAQANFLTNMVTSAIWVMTKMSTTPLALVNWKFVLFVILYGILRSSKLVPLWSFWKAAKEYDMGDASAIVSWGPGVCEERVAWLMDALIITTCVAAVVVFIIITCVIYSKGGSWMGTLKGMQNRGAPSKHSHLELVQRHTRAASGSESVDWLRPQRVNTEMTKTWPHLRRLGEDQHCVKCMAQSKEGALCCCAPHCDSHISIAYGHTGDEEGTRIIQAGETGATIGGGAAGVGTTAVVLSGAGGAEVEALLGPLGIFGGAIVGAGIGTIVVLANPGHAEAECLSGCGILGEILNAHSGHLWCQCAD
eukprot:CAMPEP_0172777342 /NCGR_PEP_ID=MMETSP1074-20121228/201350_1 /TAXON_ID=2916 /ORGANISM="Ceratium fusus, Strain PA161109" /LENGTH=318 /DNA_ID=CAMNT_0013614255 /DNA_START=453 /DNA_END=1409 /DNA_ORIENTATION=+